VPLALRRALGRAAGASAAIAAAASRARTSSERPADKAVIRSVADAGVRFEPPATYQVGEATRAALCDNRRGVGETLVRFVVCTSAADAGPACGDGPGARVFGVKPTDLAGRLGLENGDLVTAIDDVPLDSGDSVERGAGVLCSAREATVHVLRRGRERLDLRWRFVPSLAP
jgi:hypothetical protein